MELNEFEDAINKEHGFLVIEKGVEPYSPDEDWGNFSYGEDGDREISNPDVTIRIDYIDFKTRTISADEAWLLFESDEDTFAFTDASQSYGYLYREGRLFLAKIE